MGDARFGSAINARRPAARPAKSALWNIAPRKSAPVMASGRDVTDCRSRE